MHLRKALLLNLILFVASDAVHAQITLDGSLGASGALTGPNFVIPSSVGQTRGGNLFHSFGLFNVLTGESATFTGPGSISNIISRVTGGHLSTIDGLLRSDIAGAHLYLLNPAGVLFGPNASLDVKGSFHVSTADYLKFADGAKFHADLARQSVLTSAPVSAFGFLSQNPAGVSILGSSLQVPDGQTMSIVGGDIDVSFAFLGASGGTINLASVAAPGEVPADVQSFNVQTLDRLGDIRIFDVSLLDASADGGGRIVIRGGRLLVDQSYIFADNYRDLDGSANGIDVQLKQGAFITNGSNLTTDFFGAGRAGKIQFTAGTIDISDAALVASRGFFGAVGESGAIQITAGSLSITRDGQLGTSASDNGRGGDVVVAVDRLSVTGGGRIINDTNGPGHGGNVTISATESATIAGGSSFSGASAILAPSSGSGDAGNITLTTPTLTIEGGAISAQTRFGGGNAGSVEVNVDRLILTAGGQIGSSTRGSGNGGQVTVNATQAVIMDGVNDDGSRSGLFANTLGSGNGGSVAVRAPSVSLASGASVSTLSSDTGRAGTIVVESGSLTLTGRSAIVSSTVGGGDGGTVSVSATAAVSLSNSAILTDSFGTKAGGDIQIQANQIYLADNAVISASSSGSGNAGNINLTAQAFRSNNSSVETQADFADGGNIHLTVGKLVDLFNSQITASVGTGNGSGGNITIDPTAVTLNHSQIGANAFGGPGGNITIVSDVFLASPDSSVTASSALSTPGTVDIQSQITNLSGTLAPLPENVLQATSLLQQSCATRFRGGNLSSLVLGSRDGLPLEPGGFMPSPLFSTRDQRSEVRDQENQTTVGGQSSVVGSQRSEVDTPNPLALLDRIEVNKEAPTPALLSSAKPHFSLNWPCTK